MLLITLLVGLLGLFSSVSALPSDMSPNVGYARNKPRAKNGIVCCWNTSQPWQDVDEEEAKSARDLLLHAPPGDPCPVLPHQCRQIACSGLYPAEVLICNDNDYLIQPNYNYLGTYADDIIHACTWHDPFSGMDLTCGQEFDTDQYNVIAKQAIAQCPA